MFNKSTKNILQRLDGGGGGGYSDSESAETSALGVELCDVSTK